MDINQCVYFAKFGILNPFGFGKMELDLSISKKLLIPLNAWYHENKK